MGVGRYGKITNLRGYGYRGLALTILRQAVEEGDYEWFRTPLAALIVSGLETDIDVFKREARRRFNAKNRNTVKSPEPAPDKDACTKV